MRDKIIVGVKEVMCYQRWGLESETRTRVALKSHKQWLQTWLATRPKRLQTWLGLELRDSSTTCWQAIVTFEIYIYSYVSIFFYLRKYVGVTYASCLLPFAKMFNVTHACATCAAHTHSSKNALTMATQNPPAAVPFVIRFAFTNFVNSCSKRTATCKVCGTKINDTG